MSAVESSDGARMQWSLSVSTAVRNFGRSLMIILFVLDCMAGAEEVMVHILGYMDGLVDD